MNLRHDAPDELLLDYAAGSLSEPLAVLIATHLALSPSARARVEEFEAVGGALLEELPAEPVAAGVRDAVMAGLDAPRLTRSPSPPANLDLRVPAPLRDYLDGGLDDLPWKSRGPVDEVRVLTGEPGVTSRLFRIPAGRAMPRHTHEGIELTLVLDGGFTDGADHYLRGDVAAADASVDHSPVADSDAACYCFAVNDAPLRLTGSFGSLLNRFIRI